MDQRSATSEKGSARSALPLVWAALAAGAGILAADFLAARLSPGWWAALFLIAVPCWWIRGREFSFAAFLLSTTAVFAFTHAVSLREWAAFPHHERLQRGGVVSMEMEGKLGRRLNTTESGSDFVFHVTRTRDLAFQEFHPATGQVRLRLKSEVTPGDTLRVRGNLRAAEPSWNPGQTDLRQVWFRQGWQGRLTPSGPPEATILRAAPWWSLDRRADQAARWCAAMLSRELEDSPKEKSLLLAMTLGDTTGADETMIQTFRDTGTMHLFSVSGLHVAMMAMVLWIALSPLGMPRKRMALIVIPLVFGYALLTGWKPPAVRAALMASAVMGGIVWMRGNAMLNSLALAALLLLAGDTGSLFNTGFQLSFCAVAGIMLLTPPLNRLARPFTRPDPFLPRQLWSQKQVRLTRWKEKTASVFFVSAAATVATAPVMIRDFGAAAPIGLLANMVLIPLSLPVLVSAFACLLSNGAGLLTLGAVFNNASWLLCKCMAWLAWWFSSLPGAGWRHPAWERWDDGGTQTMLVSRLPGSGDFGVLMNGHRDSLLIDAGSSRDERFILSPALRWLGAGEQISLFFTHGDSHHMGGAEALTTRWSPEVLLPVTVSQSTTEKKFRAWLSEQNRPARLYREEETVPVGPRIRAEILWSPEISGTPPPADELAAVLRIEISGWHVLWLSDAGYETQRALAARAKRTGESLRCDILVKGNHRDDPRFDEEFLHLCAPRVILTRAPERTSLGDPFSWLQDWAERKRVRLINQSDEGAALCDFLDEEVRIRLWRGKTIRLLRESDSGGR